jgi:hypothetical protein
VGPPVPIEISDSELIVLDAVLAELTTRADLVELVPDRADRQALHNLVCILERANPAAFAENYGARLAEARRVLSAEP